MAASRRNASPRSSKFAELVVARARGAEQDHVPCLGELRRVSDRGGERLVAGGRRSAADSRGASAPIRCTDLTLGPIAAASGAKSSLLRRAAEDQVHGLVGVGGQRPQSGSDVRRLRVVHVADSRRARRRARGGAAHPGTCAAPRRSRSSAIPAARAAAVAAAAFSRLCAPAEQRLGRQNVVGGELDARRARARAGTTFARARSKMRSFASR